MFGFGLGVNASLAGEGAVNLDEVAVVGEEQQPKAESKMDLKAAPAVLAGLYFSPENLLPVFLFRIE